MKTKSVFLLAALAVVSLFSVSCSSDEDLTANEEEPILGEAVKAQFSISIPTDSKGVTRQSSTIVNAAQTIDDFRGIRDIMLYPSAIEPTAFDGGTTSKFIGKNIALTNLIIPGNKTVNNYIPDKNLIGTNNSVLYGDVQLQLGAKTFLFYGAAIGKDVNGTMKAWNSDEAAYTTQEKFLNGMLKQTGLVYNPADVSNIVFSPVSITTNGNSDTKRGAIVTYLNAIANATGWSSTGNAGLSNLYIGFTSMKAGSSTNLAIAIKDLYFALKDNTNEVAVAICDKIKNTEITSGTKYVTIDDENKTLTFNSAIAGYPAASDNLPEGAAVLSWDSTNGFSYSASQVSTSDMAITNLESYVYPICLYYWGKSGILTSKDSKNSLYVNTNSWGDIAKSANFEEGNTVTSKTRSVVLVNPVQYAVGRLDISVSAAWSGSDFTNATLQDKGTGVNAHNVKVSDLKLTGILIGGQRAVDWKFEPKSGSTSTECTIYDNIVLSQNEASGLAILANHVNVQNYTLVLETPGPAGDTKEKVNVALEFINNGDDFIGADGIVAKGTKFYLVGTLDASKAADADYAKTAGKIFKQDYNTRAKFTINNLKTAINTIPDLRNPQVEFGLSVDLEWKSGMELDIPIGGE